MSDATNAQPPAFQGLLRRLSPLIATQIAVQVVNMITGILLVRWLPKEEFAWFTVANSLTAVFISLVEGGTGLGVQSVGAPVRSDATALGRLINSALALRWRLGLAALICSAPIPFWLLLRNHATPSHATLILTANVIAFPALMAAGVFGGVLKLRDRYAEVIRVDLAGAFTRLCASIAFNAIRAGALAATLAAALAAVAQQFFLHRRLGPLLEPAQPVSAENQKRLATQARALWPHALFTYFHGISALWLLSITATPSIVADFSALNRLASLFAIVCAVFYQVVIPRFPHHQCPSALARRLLVTLGLYLLVTLALTAAGWIGAPWVVKILGAQYLHLTREVPCMIAMHGLVTFSVIIWWLNTARGWLSLAWLNPVLSTVIILVAMLLMRPATVMSIIGFGCFIVATPCVLGIVSTLRGLRQMRPAAS